MNLAEKDARMHLIQELAPGYMGSIETLTGHSQKEALSDKMIAAYVQQRVNKMEDALSQAKETFDEYDKLKQLALYTGEYCASIEFPF